MKVLVVDDDVVSRMVLMHLIDSCGTFDIVEAEDGGHAWEQLEAGLRPAICFCDLRMPRLSGIELLQRVKGHAALEAMPFVLVTSATDQDTVLEATTAGVAGYIVKPFQADQVRAHLDRCLVQSGASARPAAAQPSLQSSAQLSEDPAATLQRLGINGERLQVYLNGFHHQLCAAMAELAQLCASGAQHEAQARIERLHAGCVTLGLGGAAAALQGFAPGFLSGAAVQAVLAEVIRAVEAQSARLRQACVD